ncbi:cytochrome P450 [Gymnopilus junonius]|uniref:Cytochrome P450 n=1 Tax=Gymnopilus junonius TaxID=109634 RepID=A0A9P5TSA6_GYMJU|nr:cytochrome P450 [Gymnopilus junonius]
MVFAGRKPSTREPIFLSSLVAILVVCVLIVLLQGGSEDDVCDIGGIPAINAWKFFTKRYDFIQNGFQKSGGRIFRFKVLQHRVIAMAGEASRKAFFNEPGLSFLEGYKILLGGAPESKDITLTEGEIQSNVEEADFVKRLSSLIRRDRIEAALPFLLEDLDKRLKNDWGRQCQIDPFKHGREAVFQMTIRMATCQELAEDRKSIDQLMEYYSVLEKSATPVSLLLPWFPGPAKKAREKATTALFTLLFKFVKLRRQAPEPSTDAIDLLIGQGHEDQSVAGTIMRILFAGVTTTSVIFSWILLRLASNPQWKHKAIEDYKTLLSHHGDLPSELPLHKRLAVIPLGAWEDQLPSVELVLKETLRLTSAGSIIRRNVQHDITVDRVVVKRGDFLTYQVADAHLNPEIYSNPLEFDPERFVKGRVEDRKQAFAFIGWGAGRHPCIGMRMAKLEIKLLLALVLLGYEYGVVDGSGSFPKDLPLPDKNDNNQASLPFQRMYSPS